MTTRLSFDRRSHASLARAIDLEDMQGWPTVDTSAIKSAATQRRFDELKNAAQLYAAGSPMRDVLDLARVGPRWFYRLLRKCQDVAPDGQPFGFRALVKLACKQPPIRTKIRLEESNTPCSGYGGYFRKLLRDKPVIEAGLIAGLKRQGKDRLMPNTLDFRGVHRLFIRECKKAGVTDDEYPLNTQTEARRSLKAWLRSDFMAAHAASWFANEVSPAAAQSAGYSLGAGKDTRLEEPYAHWQIDEAIVDVLARYQLTTETGDTEELDLDRFMVIRVIALGSSVNLSWGLVLARQVAAHDLVSVLWDAIHGHTKIDAVIPGLDYHPDGGFPATVFPELQYVVPSVIYIDNALAHLADAFQRLVMHLWGATVRIGRPGVPQERADVESQIKLMAHQLLHQLPATTGSHPTSALRKRAKGPIAHRLVASELAHTIDVYLANKNGLPAAACRYIAPIERLRRQLADGAIKLVTLPVAARRAHLFYAPHKVTVRFDAKGGRRPFVNFFGVRYSSRTLQCGFGMVGKVMTARCDPRDLRTIWLYDRSTGNEWGCVSALGRWGKFPHDMRIRKLYLLLKRQGELGERADDSPLEQLYQSLRTNAPTHRRSATRLAYLMRYLEGWMDAPDRGVAQACDLWRESEQAANDAQTLPLLDDMLAPSGVSGHVRFDRESAEAAMPPQILTVVTTARRRIRR